MATINFPASPSVNDTYDVNGVQYTWDGTKWTSAVSAVPDSAFLKTAGGTMTGNLGVTSLNSLDFPDVDGDAGQGIVTDGAGNLTFGTATTVVTSSATSLSGSQSVQSPAILSTARKVKIAFEGVSPPGSAGFRVVLRANGADVVTNYYVVGAYAGPTLSGTTAATTTHYPVTDGQSGSRFDGIFTLAYLTANKWVADWQVSASGGATEDLISWGGGSVDLGANALDGITITNSTGNFTGGTFTIITES